MAYGIIKMKEPDIVAYLYTSIPYPDMKGVSLHHDPSCTNTETEMEPLITLKDHHRIIEEIHNYYRVRENTNHR